MLAAVAVVEEGKDRNKKKDGEADDECVQRRQPCLPSGDVQLRKSRNHGAILYLKRFSCSRHYSVCIFHDLLWRELQTS